METITKYFTLTTLVFLLIQYMSFFFRGKIIDQKLGACLLPLTQSHNKIFYIVLLLTPLVVILQLFRSLDVFVSIIIDGAALFGVEAVIRERLLKKRSGVYEHALIVDGRLLLKTGIVSFPTLSYENEERVSFEKTNADIYASDAQAIKEKTLKIVTHKKGIIFVGFTSAQERKKAVEIIRTWVE